MAVKTGLAEDRVQVWFQNRRAKEKRLLEEKLFRENQPENITRLENNMCDSVASAVDESGQMLSNSHQSLQEEHIRKLDNLVTTEVEDSGLANSALGMFIELITVRYVSRSSTAVQFVYSALYTYLQRATITIDSISFDPHFLLIVFFRFICPVSIALTPLPTVPAPLLDSLHVRELLECIFLFLFNEIQNNENYDVYMVSVRKKMSARGRIGTVSVPARLACSRLRDSRVRSDWENGNTPRPLFAYLLLLRLPHYVRTWNRLWHSLRTAEVFPVVVSLPPKNNVCEPERQTISVM